MIDSAQDTIDDSAPSVEDDPNAESMPAQEARGDEDASVDDQINALLDQTVFPIENFLAEFEQRLLAGQSGISLRQWCKKHYGVKHKEFVKYLNVIRTSWKIETTTSFAREHRRDDLRAKYNEIYRRALLLQDEDTALLISMKALGEISKLDGMTMPDVAVTINNVGTSPQTNQELTNRTRERTQKLLMLMKERSERHAAQTTRSLIALQDAKNANPGQSDPLEAPSPQVMGVVK